jgi:hypothetical protein
MVGGANTQGRGKTYDSYDAAVLRENQLCFPTPYSDKPLFPGEINIADGICLGKVDYLSRIIHQQGITKIVAKILRELDETHGNTLFTKYVNNQPMSQAFVNIHEKGQAGYQESAPTDHDQGNKGHRGRPVTLRRPVPTQ